tara:strand:+ start:287 stop:811 length:525 start_codon:yes stop_codon:yes gene_type:complete
MATLRKGKCYSKVKRSYTRRSKYKKRNFIKTAPTNKVIRFDMGELSKKFPFRVDLVPKQPIQIRHNSLESCRQIINRHLMRLIGTDYYFKIRVYPHHILRENKTLTGAGADRMQTGMQLSFGTPIGIAAQLKKNQPLFSVKVEEENIDKAKTALRKSTPRMPGKFSINIVEIKE